MKKTIRTFVDSRVFWFKRDFVLTIKKAGVGADLLSFDTYIMLVEALLSFDTLYYAGRGIKLLMQEYIENVNQNLREGLLHLYAYIKQRQKFSKNSTLSYADFYCDEANSNWKSKQDAIHNNLTTQNKQLIFLHTNKRKLKDASAQNNGTIVKS